jgi:regulator of PEP synthase PpsR (kinase-PPPase family)
VPLPAKVEALRHPLVVGLYATPERIVQIRRNRLLGLRAHRDGVGISRIVLSIAFMISI